MIIGSSQRLNKIDSISFKVDNMDLDEVSSFKYLGIIINNRFTWQDHVDQIFSKINKKLHGSTYSYSLLSTFRC